MSTSSATAVRLCISNWDRAAEVHQTLIASIAFPTFEAARAFADALPKTAQRRVFVNRYEIEGRGFVVQSDGDLRVPTALARFGRFVKAAVATGAPLEFDGHEAGSWYPATTEASIRAAFGLEAVTR